MSVVIETTIGDITIDLYTDERPRTCLNFLKLCKIKYYNFCLFHKIQRNFIAQSGDPSGTGRGGESIFQHLYGEQAKYFDSEFKPRMKHKKLGTLSMVNNGDNMNGSQFFITLGEDLTYLDEQHTVFGEVAEGFEILVKLNDTICDTNNRPYQDIRITHTVILHDPYEDLSNLEIPPSSPIPTDEILASDYVRADEDIEDNKGKTMEEIEEEIRNKEAKARATILEMVGDIPDADVRPPENVLFVCKLNPVTTDEDLEIIFSRFGAIKSCEVIKDRKTDESLQYAFIEFEREEDCETAYFKMDNVLIDDRRIHVDFSQSVAKLKFDQNNRPIIESRKPHQRERLTLKDTSRKIGNYEMIFDDDKLQESDEHKKKKKKSKKKYSSNSEESSVSSTEKEYSFKGKSASSAYKSSKKHSNSFYSSKRQPNLHKPHSSNDSMQSNYLNSKKYNSEKYSSTSRESTSHSFNRDKSSYSSLPRYSSSPERQESSKLSQRKHASPGRHKSSQKYLSSRYSSNPERQEPLYRSHQKHSPSPEKYKSSQKYPSNRYSSSPERQKSSYQSHRKHSPGPKERKSSQNHHSRSPSYQLLKSGSSHKNKHKAKKYRNDSSNSDDSLKTHTSKHKKYSHHR